MWTTPERAAEVMAYLHGVHEFRDHHREDRTPVKVVDEQGRPVQLADRGDGQRL